MFVPLNLWAQTAEVLGLRSDAPFAGGIWHFMTGLTARAGFVLPPCVYILALAGLTAWLYWRFVRRGDHFWFLPVVFLWGVLFADTPFVLLLMVAAEVFRRRTIRAIREAKGLWRRPKLPVGVLTAVTVFALGFGLMAIYNGSLRVTGGYAAGYVAKAWDDIRPTACIHPVDHRRASAVVEAYARGVAAEAGSRRWLFTDGACDDGIRIFAFAEGRSPVLVPMERLPVAGAETVLQDEVEDAILVESERARNLTEGISSFYEEGRLSNLDPELRNRFLSVQDWASRLTRMRALEQLAQIP